MRQGNELAGKVALVTGAARNIGRAIAQSLAAGGASVMVNARTSRTEAEKTVELIGSSAAMHIADITKPEEVKALVDATVKRFGRLDFLVNNAAVRFETHFEKMKYEEWRQVLAIVLDGAFLCAQAALPHMIKAGGGTIINIGGQTGHKGASERAHVITAKAGLAGMTKALALDLAPHRITVNCVVPGTIDSQRGLPGVPDRPVAPARAAADRPARRSRGDRRDGAHAVRPRRALRHRPGDPCQRRRLPAVSVSPVMQRLSEYIARAGKTQPSAAGCWREPSTTPSTRSRRWCPARGCCRARKASAFVKTLGGTKEACVIGSRFLTTAMNAALANGMSRARGRDRRLARAFGDASRLRHRARRAGDGRARTSQAGPLSCGQSRWATTSRRASRCRSTRIKFREDGHSTHSFGPTFGAAAAAGSLVKAERAPGAYLPFLRGPAGLRHLVLDARRGAHREGVRLRRHAGAQRRHRRGDGGAGLQRRGRRVLGRAQLLRRARRARQARRRWCAAWARTTRSCAPTSSAGRWARRSRRRSIRF